jgi:type 1 glutamine amidotransferase
MMIEIIPDRCFLKLCWLCLVVAASAFLAVACSDSVKMQVLVITGGHAFERAAFFEMFDSFPDMVYDEVVQPQANDIYASPDIDKYDVIVFYDMVQDITSEQKQALLDLLYVGKGMVFLHHALVSYQAWPEFERIIGGRYYLPDDSSHKPSNYKHDVEIPVEIVDANHPVTQGQQDFVIHDETYGNFVVSSGVTPLLKTAHPESGDVIAWSHTYAKSRIVYLQLGHDHHAYENPDYRALLKKSVRWVRNR